MIRRILNTIHVFLFGFSMRCMRIEQPRSYRLEYRADYFSIRPTAGCDFNFEAVALRMCVLNTYKELSYYQLMHMPTWTFRHVYQYSHEIRMRYDNIDLSRMYLN